MSGQVGILNVGAGDTKLTFDKSNPAECIRAARIVKDMLRRGYALLVETEGPEGRKLYRRVHEFDEATHEYIIADFDPVEAAKADAAEPKVVIDTEETRVTAEARDEQTIAEGDAAGAAPAAEAGEAAAAPRSKRSRPKRRIEASSARAVAVPRSAGG